MSISCKQAVDYISKKEEGKVTVWQKYQLWRHLAVCYLCKRFEKQNKQMHTCITGQKHYEHSVELPQADKDSILLALQNVEKGQA
jgi:hypothetical protein